MRAKEIVKKCKEREELKQHIVCLSHMGAFNICYSQNRLYLAAQ